MYQISESSSKVDVLPVVRQNGWALQFAAKELKADRDIVLAAVTQNGWALQFAAKELKADRDFVLAAVRQNGWALEFAAEELKADRDIVLAAVTQNGWALQFAAEELKADRDIVLAAVRQNGRALEFAAEALRNNSSFFWQIWNNQKSENIDDYRKDYISQYLLKETVKILGGAALTIVSGLLLSGIITLPFPVFVILIAAAVIGAIYTFNKVAEHGYGFFKAQTERSMYNTEHVVSFLSSSLS